MHKIYARFDKMIDARKAESELKSKGFKNTYIDATDHFQEEFSTEFSPGGRRSPSLSSLVMHQGAYLRQVDKGPLYAANPMVSGMGGFEEITGSMNSTLIINCDDEDKKNSAVELVKNMGGHIG